LICRDARKRGLSGSSWQICFASNKKAKVNCYFTGKFPKMISRRNFVKNSSLSLLSGSLLIREKGDHPVLSQGPSIRQISIHASSGSFYRFIGPNAYDDKPKGIKGNSRKMLRVELSNGMIGLGTLGYQVLDSDILAFIQKLVGIDIFTLYLWKDERIVGVSPVGTPYFFDANYAWVESAILDALGQFFKKPVWKFFGDGVRDGIDPYDGTIYFEDIVQDGDARVIGNIGKRIKQDGYRAVKLKLGRPDKWMPGEAGVERDIEAFIALREAVGNNFNIMADANNGYKNKFDWAVNMLEACAPYNMYFIEELFPDNMIDYTKLRNILLKENMFIPIAEGENIKSNDMLEIFTEYCNTGVYHYIQPDIPTCGFSNILRIARMAEKHSHVKLIPHVWQSQMGLIMSAHLSKIQPNVPFVEDSRYDEHALMTTDYQFVQGQWFLPESPGWGIQLTPDFLQFMEGEALIIQ
jgi:L-alanine-DL-glutamate epimerase-like enolase superfamily enzyme